MKRLTKYLLVAGILMGLAQHAAAQDINLARVEPGTQRLQFAGGLDPAVLTTVGYARGFGLGSKTAVWDIDLGMGAAEADAKDLRLRLGLQTPLWQSGSWLVAGRGRLVARSTSNSVYDGAGFGADLTVHAGIYRRGWFLAGLVGYDRTFVTHIEHSDWYRDNVYAEAVDGWYQGKSGILHGGLAAGFAVGQAELAARVEWRRLDGGETLDPPVVGELSVSVPF